MTTWEKLGVQKVKRRFAGQKINAVSEIIGKRIKILDFEICKSKRNADGTYMKLQILVGGTKRFMSTGSKYLQEILSQVDPKEIEDNPIDAVILQRNGYLYFKGTLADEDVEADEFDNMTKSELRNFAQENGLKIQSMTSTDDELRYLLRTVCSEGTIVKRKKIKKAKTVIVEEEEDDEEEE